MRQQSSVQTAPALPQDFQAEQNNYSGAVTNGHPSLPATALENVFVESVSPCMDVDDDSLSLMLKDTQPGRTTPSVTALDLDIESSPVETDVDIDQSHGHINRSQRTYDVREADGFANALNSSQHADHDYLQLSCGGMVPSRQSPRAFDSTSNSDLQASNFMSAISFDTGISDLSSVDIILLRSPIHYRP